MVIVTLIGLKAASYAILRNYGRFIVKDLDAEAENENNNSKSNQILKDLGTKPSGTFCI